MHNSRKTKKMWRRGASLLLGGTVLSATALLLHKKVALSELIVSHCLSKIQTPWYPISPSSKTSLAHLQKIPL
jgi:hypothetical protein